MAEAISTTGELVGLYNFIISSLPPFSRAFVTLFFTVVLIFFYLILVWKFSKFISKKNIFGINLNRYNTSEHGTLGGFFYFLEYIVILPFLVFVWFSFLAISLIILNAELDVNNVLIISAAVVAAIRMTAYYSHKMSLELAKLLPLNLLAVSILSPGFFEFAGIIGNIAGVANLLGNIFNYFAFIIILEGLLRFFDFAFSLLGLDY
ncbi:hypothetical protein HY449_01280 [Candidatus Pacearchaeota archaeon]|nr:hypothetical protein [Candidatus Pacearchaeota archaeon]